MNRRVFHVLILAAVFTVALTWAVPLTAEVPPRSTAGRTLAVPEAELDRGQIYYLVPGGDAQLAVTSKAPLRKMVVLTGDAVGYLVAPFDLEDADVPFLAGAFRVPVPRLATGSGEVDEMLRGGDFLDADAHREITFELAAPRDVEVVERAEDLFRYRARLVGHLGVKGTKKELEVPVDVTFRMADFQTMGRYLGDLAIVEGRTEIALADLGWEIPRPYRGQLAETLSVELYLLLSTVTPDKNIDMRVDPARHAREQRFLTLARDLADPAAAYEHARVYLKEIWDDAAALARLARMIVEEEGLAERDLALARKAAQRAQEVSGGRDARAHAVLAAVHDALGDAAAAVAWQKKAVEMAPGDVAAQMEARLERYQAKVPAAEVER